MAVVDNSLVRSPLEDGILPFLLRPAPMRSSEADILHRAYLSSKSSNFFEKHFAPAGFGALAWIQSLIDLPTQAAHSITWALLSIVGQGEGALDHFKLGSYLGGTAQSALHLIMLPLLILAGIFMPTSTWEILDRNTYLQY